MLFNKLIIFIPSISVRNWIKKLFVIFEQWVTIHPARLFLIIAFFWMSLMFFINKKEGIEWDDILIEANGMVFDLFVFGALLAWYDGKRQKNERIERNKNLIDDFRGWDEKEAMYRIIGAVRRLKREGNIEINLTKCYLAGADLSRLDLSEIALTEANLSFTNLTNISLVGLDLSRTIFKGANLTNANLAGADLSYANLAGADLRNANLSGANLTYANLEGANLSKANLSNANLFGAHLASAVLTNADLSYSDLSSAKMSEYFYIHGGNDDYEPEEHYSDNDWEYEDPFQSEEYLFYENRLQYYSADLSEAILIGAKLKHTKMEYVDLRQANLSGANLYGASLSGAYLNRANLFGTDISTADLSEAHLENVIIRGNWMEKIVTYKVKGCEEIIEKYILEEQDGKILIKKKPKK
jgi:uncharacterized protein YjbI with pentapeptide repeats